MPAHGLQNVTPIPAEKKNLKTGIFTAYGVVDAVPQWLFYILVWNSYHKQTEPDEWEKIATASRPSESIIPAIIGDLWENSDASCNENTVPTYDEPESREAQKNRLRHVIRADEGVSKLN